MTVVLDQPRTAAAKPTGPTRAQVWARGAMSAASTAAVTASALLVLVLVAWVADARSGGSAADAARVGMGLWLLAVRTPLHVADGWVALPPLGLTLVIGVMLARSAGSLLAWRRDDTVVDLRAQPPRRESDRPSVLIVAEVIGAVAVPFAVVTTILAVIAGSSAMQPSPLVAAVDGLLLAGVAGLIGTRGSGWWRDLVGDRLAEPVSVGLAGALRACLILLGAASLLVLASFVWHLGTALDLAGTVGGGAVGGVGTAVVSLALLPNAVVGAVGYLTGAGVSVGVGNVATPATAHLSAIPPLPLLAAVPHAPAPAPVRLVLWAIVIGAGVAAALWRRADSGSIADAVVTAATRAVATALFAGVVVAVASGPAGAGRLATVGASGWRTGLLLLAEMGFATAVAEGVRWAWPRVRRLAGRRPA